MTRKYIEHELLQASKKAGDVCGDYALCIKKEEHTTFILCDGMGSGIKANIPAIMFASRLARLLQSEMSLEQACESVVASLHTARTEDTPFAAFSAARIHSDGRYTILSFEMPPPLILEKSAVYLPRQRFFTLGREVVAETTGILRNGDSLLFVSDGVSQAGLGHGYNFGWTIEGVRDYLNSQLNRFNLNHSGARLQLPQAIMNEVQRISGPSLGDDTSIALLHCREARTLNILTGPPVHKERDREFVAAFLNSDGKKAICGSTTSDLFFRHTGRPVKVETVSASYSQPPRYSIEGIDLVTEGVITLNQVYNIIGEDPDNLDEDSCVSGLCRLLADSDIIRFSVGNAINPGHKSLSFKQMGLIPRQRIVKLIADRLREMGKLVVIQEW